VAHSGTLWRLRVKEVTIGSWSYLVVQKFQLFIPWELGDNNIQISKFFFFWMFITVNFIILKLMKIRWSSLFFGPFSPYFQIKLSICQGHRRTQEHSFISEGSIREIPVTLLETCIALIPKWRQKACNTYHTTRNMSCSCIQVKVASMQYLSHYQKYISYLYPSEGSKYAIPITLLETCLALIPKWR
jgi:hypothetical protein